MTIAGKAPDGGVVAKLGGRSRPLVLTIDEIERFEAEYSPVGFFEVMGQFFGRGPQPQARHCRDLVALGLVGGGMSNQEADKILADMRVCDLLEIKSVAQDLIVAAFAPRDSKKKAALDGSPKSRAKPTSTRHPKSKAQSKPD